MLPSLNVWPVGRMTTGALVMTAEGSPIAESWALSASSVSDEAAALHR